MTLSGFRPLHSYEPASSTNVRVGAQLQGKERGWPRGGVEKSHVGMRGGRKAGRFCTIPMRLATEDACVRMYVLVT